VKKPLILTTASNNTVENMDVVRLNHEYVNARVQAGGVPLPITSTFGLEELAALSDPPVSKSAVNHRLRKLVELSKAPAEEK
jgi:hypothetical protein